MGVGIGQRHPTRSGTGMRVPKQFARIRIEARRHPPDTTGVELASDERGAVLERIEVDGSETLLVSRESVSSAGDFDPSDASPITVWRNQQVAVCEGCIGAGYLRFLPPVAPQKMAVFGRKAAQAAAVKRNELADAPGFASHKHRVTGACFHVRR